MGRYHANLVRDAERVEYIGGALHRFPIGRRSHNDSDQGFHAASLAKPTRETGVEAQKAPAHRRASAVPGALSRPFPAVWPTRSGPLGGTPGEAHPALSRVPTAACRASARSVGNAEFPDHGVVFAPRAWRALVPGRFRASTCRYTAVAGSALRERADGASHAVQRTGCPAG